MKTKGHQTQTAQPAMATADVQTLARKAISVLAAHGAEPRSRLQGRLELVCDAFICGEEEPRHDVIDQMRRDGLSPEEIIDHILPAVARLMGQRWFDDQISFVHVTIGTARLQETVRALSVRQRMLAPEENSRTVLLVLPKPEHHTLGAFILGEQLRRFGYAVDVAVDQSPKQIAELLRKRRFAMIGITASGRRTLASTTELVDIIRGTVTHVTPIVIGGTVLETGLDVLGITGADFVAQDARTALELCGLSVAEKGPSPNVTADHVD